MTIARRLALLLAVIGVYAVMSYNVSQRTREMGLRMALGADASNLMRLIIFNGLALTAGGVVLGFASFVFPGEGMAGCFFDGEAAGVAPRPGSEAGF